MLVVINTGTRKDGNGDKASVDFAGELYLFAQRVLCVFLSGDCFDLSIDFSG